MTDEEMAKDYAEHNQGKYTNEFGNLYHAYLAGLKVGRQEKYHYLKKNPKDLPKENQEVLVLFTLPDKSKNDVMMAQFENNDFNFVDLQDVIAWCEIPTFEE